MFTKECAFRKGVGFIACPHMEISIRNRTGSSAVAGAAYAAGVNLFSEYEQRKIYYSKKHNQVIHSEILLPPNAPKEYFDREVLWNSAEKAEKPYNAQLARNIIAALPNEIPREQLSELCREFCQEQFVDKGMCCDFSIHDKGDGNPHVHILLTLRAIDDEGNWMPKCHKIYDLDENGERIKLESGEWKSHREDVTDWNNKENCEKWRSAWADIQNKYYERNNCDVRIDLHSYERQGKDVLPTVHMGPYVAALEEKGVTTELGNFNREILEYNRKKMNLLDLIAELVRWIAELVEKLKYLRKEIDRQPTLQEMLCDYLDIRQKGRSNWGYYAKQNCAIKDLKMVTNAINILNEQKLETVDDLKIKINGADELKNAIADNKNSIKNWQIILNKLEIVNRNRNVFKTSKEGSGYFFKQYQEKHKAEIDDYTKAVQYLKINHITTNTTAENFDKLIADYKEKIKSVKSENIQKQKILDTDYKDMNELYKITNCISQVLDDMNITVDGINDDESKRKTPIRQSQTSQPKSERNRESIIDKLNAAQKKVDEEKKANTFLQNKKSQER